MAAAPLALPSPMLAQRPLGAAPLPTMAARSTRRSPAPASAQHLCLHGAGPPRRRGSLALAAPAGGPLRRAQTRRQRQGAGVAASAASSPASGGGAGFSPGAAVRGARAGALRSPNAAGARVHGARVSNQPPAPRPACIAPSATRVPAACVASTLCYTRAHTTMHRCIPQTVARPRPLKTPAPGRRRGRAGDGRRQPRAVPPGPRAHEGPHLCAGPVPERRLHRHLLVTPGAAVQVGFALHTHKMRSEEQATRPRGVWAAGWVHVVQSRCSLGAQTSRRAVQARAARAAAFPLLHARPWQPPAARAQLTHAD